MSVTYYTEMGKNLQIWTFRILTRKGKNIYLKRVSMCYECQLIYECQLKFLYAYMCVLGGPGSLVDIQKFVNIHKYWLTFMLRCF
jgi:hypothetical protein